MNPKSYSNAVFAHLVTISALNSVNIELRWSRFVDGAAEVEVAVEGYVKSLPGLANNSDPHQARIMAINNALKNSGFNLPG